ncbi:acyl-CoA binding protein [Trifolium repens]|nr:acyl-CoA binding protein [Trifolium repens]
MFFCKLSPLFLVPPRISTRERRRFSSQHSLSPLPIPLFLVPPQFSCWNLEPARKNVFHISHPSFCENIGGRRSRLVFKSI